MGEWYNTQQLGDWWNDGEPRGDWWNNADALTAGPDGGLEEPGHTTANGQSTLVTIDEGDTLTIDAVITASPAPWGANVVNYQLQFFDDGWDNVGTPEGSSDFPRGVSDLGDAGLWRIVVIDTVTSRQYPLRAVSVSVVPTFSEVVDGGITFEFASPVAVGQYISGDWWALSATVDAVLPVSAQVSGTYDNAEAFTDRWVHGLMVDPGRDGGTGANPATTPQGWDSLPKAPSISQATEFAYDHSKNLDPGATSTALSGVSSLVKARSIITAPDATGRRKLARAVILTIVDSAPPATAFRRWAGNISKAPIFFTTDIDWTVLPSLTQPTGSTLPDPDALIAKLGPFQTYMNQQLFARGVAPTEQQQAYGGDIANDVLQAIFYTMTDGVSEANRNRVAIRLIQAGLDVYDATEYGRRWSSSTFSFGGSHQWFKTLMVYAARLLRTASNTAELAKMVAWCDGTTNKIFADDMMLFTIDRTRIESTPFENLLTRLWPQGLPDWSENTISWLSKPSSNNSIGLSWDISYKNFNNLPLMCSALVARFLGAEAIWNNPQFFEYYDRWYNWWIARGKPSGGNIYFHPYNAEIVDDFYAANWGAAGSVSLVRREARGRYAWIECNTDLSVNHQPAATDITVEVDDVAQTLTSISTTAGGTQSSGTTNFSQPVITVASATGIRVGQRIECASLPICFVASVDGTTIGISEKVPATFSGQAITFYNVFSWGRSLVAVLPAPLTTDTPVVEIGYTSPMSGFVRNLRGTKLDTIAIGTATNRTGQLPVGPSAIETPYTGAVLSERQYSGSSSLRSESIVRFRLSMRFVLSEAVLANDTWVSSATGSTTTFRMYAATTSALRVLFAGRQLRAPTTLGSLPLDTVLTLHMFIDGSATSHSDANKGTIVWDGGGVVFDTSTSIGVIDGSYTTNIGTVLSGGLFVNATGSGLNAPEGGVRELTIGWGDGSLALPADFSGAQFAHDAVWGANGQNVWGQNQLYYAGTVVEWNGGLPNRGNYGSLTLSPRRFFDADEGILLTDYTAYPFP